MKNILVLGAVVLVLGAGYYFFVHTAQEEVPAAQESFTGSVVTVDLEPVTYDGPALLTVRNSGGETRIIAVPSMGLPLCEAYEQIASPFEVAVGDLVSVVGSIDELGRIVPCQEASHRLEVTGVEEDAVLGYVFEYTKGPNGYLLLEDSESTDADFLSGVVLFNRAEYEELQASTDAREGPPAIHVRVYENPQKHSAFVWPEKKPLESNSNLALGEPAEAVVGGANANHYLVDGLYPIDTYVVAHDNKIYVLMGAYLEEGSAIHQEFQALVDSFTFIPASS